LNVSGDRSVVADNLKQAILRYAWFAWETSFGASTNTMSTDNHIDRAIRALTLGAGVIGLIVYAILHWL
jgi:hypothetical protein